LLKEHFLTHRYRTPTPTETTTASGITHGKEERQGSSRGARRLARSKKGATLAGVILLSQFHTVLES
jgi:hypothetical protein